MIAYKRESSREDIEHICYSNLVSDYEDKKEIKKSRHNPRGHLPLLKPVSCDGNLHTTTVREGNVHDLASPGTQIPKHPPSNVIFTNIE